MNGNGEKKSSKRWIIHRLAEIIRLCDNTGIGWNYLCIFDAKYKFRNILLQLIWALVLFASLNPFELGVILLWKDIQEDQMRNGLALSKNAGPVGFQIKPGAWTMAYSQVSSITTYVA